MFQRLSNRLGPGDRTGPERSCRGGDPFQPDTRGGGASLLASGPSRPRQALGYATSPSGSQWAQPATFTTAHPSRSYAPPPRVHTTRTPQLAERANSMGTPDTVP